MRQSCDTRPGLLIRRTEKLKNGNKLGKFTFSGEKWLARSQLRKHTAHGSDVYRRQVVRLTKQNLRGTVVQCHDLCGVGLQWQTKRSTKTKVGQLHHFLIPAHEDVVWLDVTVHDSTTVTGMQTGQELVHDTFQFDAQDGCQSLIKHSFQILVKVLKHQLQLRVGANDIK